MPPPPAMLTWPTITWPPRSSPKRWPPAPHPAAGRAGDSGLAPDIARRTCVHVVRTAPQPSLHAPPAARSARPLRFCLRHCAASRARPRAPRVRSSPAAHLHPCTLVPVVTPASRATGPEPFLCMCGGHCRSGAARANRPQSRGSFPPVLPSVIRTCTYALRRYLFTPDTACCMSCPVCVRVRSLARLEPLTLGNPMEKAIPLRYTARVTEKTHGAISTACRATSPTTGPSPGENPIARFLRSARGSDTLTDRRRLFPR